MSISLPEGRLWFELRRTTILADKAGQRRDRVHGLLRDRFRRRGAAPGRPTTTCGVGVNINGV